MSFIFEISILFLLLFFEVNEMKYVFKNMNNKIGKQFCKTAHFSDITSAKAIQKRIFIHIVSKNIQN